MTSHLATELKNLGIDLSPAQLEQLTGYRDLLTASSREFNLTSLRQPDAIERRHLLESLAFGLLLKRHELIGNGGGEGDKDGVTRVLDIGSGAGLPGVPLKIAWPALELVMLESVGKKCRFLEQVRDRLQLERVQVIEGRAEELGRDPAHRESYDLVVARAVAPLPVLLEYALPLLRVGGWLAAPKGSAALSELGASEAALSALGGRLHDAVPWEPPQGLRQTVALVQKTQPTDARYPRRTGIPSKRPL